MSTDSPRRFALRGSSLQALIAYTAIAIVMTWPLATRLGREIAWDLGDPVFNSWVMMWTSGQVLSALGVRGDDAAAEPDDALRVEGRSGGLQLAVQVADGAGLDVVRRGHRAPRLVAELEPVQRGAVAQPVLRAVLLDAEHAEEAAVAVHDVDRLADERDGEAAGARGAPAAPRTPARPAWAPPTWWQAASPAC